MDKADLVKTAVVKHGAIDASRYYIRGARSALNSIKIGIESNNFALASRDVGLLQESIDALERIFGIEDALPQIQHLNKNVK